MTSPRFSESIVLGKFMPPHHGHRVVISAARAQSRHVTLIVSVLPTDPIPAQQRINWLQQLYPTTTVIAMPVSWDSTDAQAWANGALAALGGRRPDAVFSSEKYGHLLAELWRCTHILVDHDRTIVPISATEIRRQPEKYRQYLDPIVWTYFTTQTSKALE